MHRCRPYLLVLPKTGLRETRAAAVSYRALAPDGAGRSCRISTTHPLARHSATQFVIRGHDLPQLCGGNSSDHCSLIPAHSSHTFSAKEKDSETGLSYFGSRYYSSDLSIWLSVDPMSDKYPSLSPYVYCADNPVKLVDPNGEEVLLIGKHAKTAFQNMQQGTNLKLKMGRFGKITAEGEAISEADELLLKAINSKSVCAIVLCGDKGSAGSYMGTTYNKKNGTAVSLNSVNVPAMQRLEQENNAPTGSGLIHEATEGYWAGETAISSRHNIRAASLHLVEPPAPMEWNNMQFTFDVVDEWKADYPRDYKKYLQAHNNASLAPNEMSPSQKQNYKNPSARYIFNKFFTR